MSVDTTALLFGAPSQEEVAAALRAAFNCEAIVEPTSLDDEMFKILFPEPAGKLPNAAEKRMMFVFPNNNSGDYKDIYSGAHTYCSLGMWGSSVEIMEALATRFGGYIRDSDANNEWRRIEANPDTAPELSSEDILRIELADSVGTKFGTALAGLVDEPEKLEKVMKAYSSYMERKETSAPAP